MKSGHIGLESYDNPHLLDVLKPRPKRKPREMIVFDEEPVPQRVLFVCPECGKEMSVAESRIGQDVFCDGCRTLFRLEDEPC